MWRLLLLPVASAWLMASPPHARLPLSPRATDDDVLGDSAAALGGDAGGGVLDMDEEALAALSEEALAAHVHALAAEAGPAEDDEDDDDDDALEDARRDAFFALLHSGRGYGGLRDADAVRGAVARLAPRTPKECTVAIGALGRAGDARGALALLGEMTGDVVAPPSDDGAALDSADADGRARATAPPAPNALCYAAAINACGRADECDGGGWTRARTR